MIAELPPLAEQFQVMVDLVLPLALVGQLESHLAAARSTAEKLMDAVLAKLTAR